MGSDREEGWDERRGEVGFLGGVPRGKLVGGKRMKVGGGGERGNFHTVTVIRYLTLWRVSPHTQIARFWIVDLLVLIHPHSIDASLSRSRSALSLHCDSFSGFSQLPI